MQDLYKVLYFKKKPFLVFFLIILISSIVLAENIVETYNDPITYSMGDARWCQLIGCTVVDLIVDTLTVYNLSVIGDVFNVTMNLVTWNITESFNVGGDLTADAITSEGNITINTGVNANPTLKYREGAIDNGFDIMTNLFATNYLQFNAIDGGVSTTRFRIRRLKAEIDSYSNIDFQNDYNITNLDCLEFNNKDVCDWDEVNVTPSPHTNLTADDVGGMVDNGTILRNKTDAEFRKLNATDDVTFTFEGNEQMIITRPLGFGIPTYPLEIRGAKNIMYQGQILLSTDDVDNAVQSGGLSLRHYDIDEEEIALFLIISTDTATNLRIGGSLGGINAPTSTILTIAETTTSTTDREVFRATYRDGDAIVQILDVVGAITKFGLSSIGSIPQMTMYNNGTNINWFDLGDFKDSVLRIGNGSGDGTGTRYLEFNTYGGINSTEGANFKGNVSISGELNHSGANATFEQDVTIKGTLHGGSPVKIEGVNITNNLFMLEENRNSSSRFTLQNLNSGENATAVITAKNDVGGTMSIGIGSSNFMLGNKNYQNITALISRSRGGMVSVNSYNEPFIWLYNPSDDNDLNNLVEIMRLDEKGLNVSANLTIRDFGSINQLVIGNYTPTDLFDSDSLTVVDGFDLIHTATFSDDHAFEIDLDASGFGDVKAIDINYITGAITTGQDEEAILVNIDDFLSTGGTVIGLGVITTEGLANVYGMEVGALVNPILQLSGEFSDENLGTVNEVDRLAEFLSITLDIDIFVNDDDNITIGSPSKFEEIEFILNTTASGSGIAPIFEFSTGEGTWDEFNPTDGTNGIRNNGVVVWLDEDIPTWETSGGNYIIQITRTKNSLTTNPIENKIRIVVGAEEFLWDKDGNLTINSLKSIEDLKGSYVGGQAYVCVLDDGTVFASDSAC